mgnify:CR=1 FL=1
MKSTQPLLLSTLMVVALSATGAYLISSGVLSSPPSPPNNTDTALHASPSLSAEAVLPYTLLLPDPHKQAADRARNLAFYQKRVKTAPTSFLDHNLLANAYITQAKVTHDTSWYLLAQKTAERSLDLHATNPGAWQVLFAIAQAKHDFVSAEKLHLQILKANAGANSAILANHISQRMAQNQLLEAREAAELWVKKEPLLSALSQLALVEEAQGHYDEALAHLYKGIQREQTGDTLGSSQARAWAGRILAKQGHFGLAERFYQEALRIDPQNLLAHELQGDLAFKNQDYSKALAAYSSASVIDPAPVFLLKQAQVHAALAQEPQANALKREAEAALRRELTGNRFGHRRELALILLEKNTPTSAQEAQTLMTQEYALRQDPKTVYLFARSLNANHEWGKAQEIIQRALDQGAVEGRLLQEAARTEAHLGDKQKAAAYTRAAQRYDRSLS